MRVIPAVKYWSREPAGVGGVVKRRIYTCSQYPVHVSAGSSSTSVSDGMETRMMGRVTGPKCIGAGVSLLMVALRDPICVSSSCSMHRNAGLNHVSDSEVRAGGELHIEL
jgi:hypothetical protein